MDRFIQLFVQFGQFLEKFAWTVADHFMPEAREGYPYIMWDVMANLAANAANIPYPAASFANPTTDEMVVEYFRFEAQPAAAALAAGGTAVIGGANDFNVAITVKDMAHNATFMQNPVPIGLILDPIKRVWYPSRRIILPGGNQSALQISVTNLTGGGLTNIYAAAHCHARTRKNTPQ
jgi:hypothetical protein